MKHIIQSLKEANRHDLINHLNKLAANKFKVWIEPIESNYGTPATEKKKTKVIDEKEFDTKPDAKKYERELKRKYHLKPHAGHIVNYKDGFELWTNY